MKNDFEIRGDTTVIFLDRKDGSRLECLIDTSDLPRAMEFKYKWSPHWDRHTESFYAEGKTYEGRTKDGHQKRKYFSLHRWIMQPPDGTEVDHINHNTLDDRRSNMRVIPKGANQQNYKNARRHNKSSGVKGVSWNKNICKWVVTYRLNKKSHHVGVFTDLEEAKKVAYRVRVENMPYSWEAYNERIKGANL